MWANVFLLELTGYSSYVEKIFFTNPGYKLKLIDEISFVLNKKCVWYCGSCCGCDLKKVVL
jgi:hypothetical protein